MNHIFPVEIINYIYSFYNPYKIIYNNIILEIKSKNIYKFVMKQLLQFNVRNRKGEILYFAIDAILQRIR